MPHRNPLPPSTSSTAAPLTAKLVALRVAAVAIAVGVTTWLACTSGGSEDQTPKKVPTPVSNNDDALDRDLPPTAEPPPRRDKIKKKAPVMPATKMFVLPDNAPETESAKNGVKTKAKTDRKNNRVKPLRVFSGTKSGRIDRKKVMKAIDWADAVDLGATEIKPPPPPIFPGTKAAMIPPLQPEATAPSDDEETAKTKRRRRRRARNSNANASAPPPQAHQQAVPQQASPQ